jgi:hypothetical protein
MAFISGLIGFILFLFMMILDNILWISGSPEYKYYKEATKKEKLEYIIKQRIIPVLTAWRDIVPAVITGVISGIIF